MGESSPGCEFEAPSFLVDCDESENNEANPIKKISTKMRVGVENILNILTRFLKKDFFQST